MQNVMLKYAERAIKILVYRIWNTKCQIWNEFWNVNSEI